MKIIKLLNKLWDKIYFTGWVLVIISCIVPNDRLIIISIGIACFVSATIIGVCMNLEAYDQRRYNAKRFINSRYGKLMRKIRCSNILSHNFKDFKDNTKCKHCDMTVIQVKKEYEKYLKNHNL